MAPSNSTDPARIGWKPACCVVPTCIVGGAEVTYRGGPDLGGGVEPGIPTCSNVQINGINVLVTWTAEVPPDHDSRFTVTRTPGPPYDDIIFQEPNHVGGGIGNPITYTELVGGLQSNLAPNTTYFLTITTNVSLTGEVLTRTPQCSFRTGNA